MARTKGTTNAVLPTDLAFAPAEIPTLTRNRTRKPNPYSDVVTAMAVDYLNNGTKAGLSAVIANELVGPLRTKLNAAGREAGITVHIAVKDAGKGQSAVTFWPGDKRTRKTAKSE